MHSFSQLAAMFRLPSWPCYNGLPCYIGVFKKKDQPAGLQIQGTKSALFIRRTDAIYRRARNADQMPSPHNNAKMTGMRAHSDEFGRRAVVRAVGCAGGRART